MPSMASSGKLCQQEKIRGCAVGMRESLIIAFRKHPLTMQYFLIFWRRWSVHFQIALVCAPLI
jgi:hypothetical protein